VDDPVVDMLAKAKLDEALSAARSLRPSKTCSLVLITDFSMYFA